MRWLALALIFLTLGVVMAKGGESGAAVAPVGTAGTVAHSGIRHVALHLPAAAEGHDTANEPSDNSDAASDTEPDWQIVTVKSGDSLARMLAREGVSHATVHRLVTSSEHGERLSRLRPGENIRIAFNEDEQLTQLVHEVSLERELRFERNGDGFVSELVEEPLERRLEHASGTIRGSLVEAGRAAGMGLPLTLNLANIFAWDIDFALDLRRGDRFHVIYEALYKDGEYVRDGNVIAAEFINDGRVHRALRYTDPTGETDYYSPDGNSVRSAFLRAPVEYTRITSTFGPRRHPKLHTMRNHNGVDYAAPTGTPVRATGDGRIVRRGWHGGYGRTVIIQHGERYNTLYAHMSRFHPDRGVGARVQQGDIVGYVGQSGLATGPHVHYEFLIDNTHRDPQTVELPSGDPVDPEHRDHFVASTALLTAQLDTLRRTFAVAQP